MKSFLKKLAFCTWPVWVTVLIVTGVVVAQQGPEIAGFIQRPISDKGKSAGVSYFYALPGEGRDGEVGVLLAEGETAVGVVYVYDGSTSTWTRSSRTDGTENTVAKFGATDLADSSIIDDGTTVEFTKRTFKSVTRQEFDQSCLVREAADFSAELVSDAGINIVLCPSGGSPYQGINMFEFRLDGDQASPFIVDGAGALDIDNDGTENEGMEFVVASTSAPVGGVIDVATSPAKYFKVGFTIASIDGTDNFFLGWRLAAAYVDDLVLTTIDTGAQFHWNSKTGNCLIRTQDDGTDANDEVTACDLADAEEMHVRVEIDATGDPSFYYAASEVLLETATVVAETNTGTATAAAGDMLVPFGGVLNSDVADSEIKILYVDIGEVQ